MKIGIIADRLNRPLTGIGNVVYNLIKELSKINKENIYLINYKENSLFPELNKIIIRNAFEKFPQKYSHYFWHLYLNYYLSRKKLDLDIIHSPENVSLFVKLKNQKKIITVYDIMAFCFPKVSDFITRYRYAMLLSRTLKTADKIISISYNTKSDLIKYFKIPESKIKVIHLAASENYKPLNEYEINKIKQKYCLNDPFILYVGALAPNKNLERLINAYCKLKKHQSKHKLIMAGAKRYKYKSIFETIRKLNLEKDVIFTGYVPDEDLPALYSAADLFVFPSLYEGFGLPPLEAMACGTPVITSNTSSLPEVVGDAGIMVNPYDIDELANKMYEVLDDTGLREELSRKGLERAKLFSWKKCAEEHIKVYEEVYNMGCGGI